MPEVLADKLIPHIRAHRRRFVWQNLLAVNVGQVPYATDFASLRQHLYPTFEMTSVYVDNTIRSRKAVVMALQLPGAHEPHSVFLAHPRAMCMPVHCQIRAQLPRTVDQGGETAFDSVGMPMGHKYFYAPQSQEQFVFTKILEIAVASDHVDNRLRQLLAQILRVADMVAQMQYSVRACLPDRIAHIVNISVRVRND